MSSPTRFATRAARRRTLRSLLAAPLLAAGLSAGGAAHAELAGPELALAERLIERVGAQRELRFVRNGREHDAAEAADHLRRKLHATRGRLETADQFIEHVASGSSLTGEPYRMRLADGRSVLAGQWLREQLAQLRAHRS